MLKTPPMTPAEQRARFIEAAKKAEVDESGQKFEEAFTTIVKNRALPQTKKNK